VSWPLTFLKNFDFVPFMGLFFCVCFPVVLAVVRHLGGPYCVVMCAEWILLCVVTKYGTGVVATDNSSCWRPMCSLHISLGPSRPSILPTSLRSSAAVHPVDRNDGSARNGVHLAVSLVFKRRACREIWRPWDRAKLWISSRTVHSSSEHFR
jgi:hypothetical protein